MPCVITYLLLFSLSTINYYYNKKIILTPNDSLYLQSNLYGCIPNNMNLQKPILNRVCLMRAVQGHNLDNLVVMLKLRWGGGMQVKGVPLLRLKKNIASLYWDFQRNAGERLWIVYTLRDYRHKKWHTSSF